MISAVGSAPARHAGGRGFKSLIIHTGSFEHVGVVAGLSNMILHAWRSGSASRSYREGRGFESLSVHLRGLAQLGARALWEREVASSILASPTQALVRRSSSPAFARLAQWISAPDFGSGGWGFESLVEH